MMTSRHLTIYAICSCLCASRLIAAVEWQVIKINGRDYLSADNIAKFYGFPTPIIDGKIVKLSSASNEMQFRLDSREMLLNGVRNWLSFPVVVQHGTNVVC